MTSFAAIIVIIAVWIFAFAVAVSIHEFSHAYIADKLGDPTPKLDGRLSLNPLVHYDPVGTTLLLVLVVLYILGLFPVPFGWAKPVRIDPFNFRNPRKDEALVSVAGPASNIILAVILSLIARFAFTAFSPLSGYVSLITPLIVLNIALGIFNLIPIHPLDGGKILVGIIPQKYAVAFDSFLNRYGLILLLFVIFPIFRGQSIISLIISPLVNFILSILIPGSGAI